MSIKRVENLEYLCEGCEQTKQETLSCGVYADVPPYYIRHGCCPFNMPKRQVVKVVRRVGQGKTKSGGNR
jgi:hypothetical protein